MNTYRTKQITILTAAIGLLLSGSMVLASEITGNLNTGIGNSNVDGVVIVAPTASVAAGTYTSTQSVTLTATGSQSIHYTTSGTDPTCSTGTAYSSAISIDSSVTLKAISCYANSNASTVSSYVYTISAPVVSTSNSNAGGGGGGGWYTAPAPTPTTTTTPTTGTTGTSSALRQQQLQLLSLLILQLQSLLVQARAQGINLPAGTEQIIGSLTAPTTPTTPSTPSTGYTFTRNLETGAIGEDVKQLQIYLNAKGFKVALSGPGSPGNETTKFGAGTRVALSKFQKSVGISPAAGYFGATTRAYVNAHP